MRIAAALLLAASAFAMSPAVAVRPIAFAASAPAGNALVLPLASAADLGGLGGVDPGVRQAVASALSAASFDFALGSTLSLRGIGAHPLILVVGTGGERLTAASLNEIGGIAARETASVDGPVSLIATGIATQAPEAATDLAVGAGLGGYRFDEYKFKDPAKPDPAGRKAALTIVGDGAAAWDGRGRALVEAVAFTRDLVNEPSNVVYPESFVERTRAAFKGVRGVTIEALDVPAMEKLGMGAIMSVGRGSVRPPRMLIVEYKGSGASGAPIVLAGKGITFDSGGISLKPGSGMWEMKGDMSGAAAVVGTALSLAKSGAPVHVVAIAALAENMPSGTATRPGDVVRAYDGKTIEILNTDAEGRMVLADAVSYGERRFRPAALVDVATLTGAKVVALGNEHAALFSRSDSLARQLEAAGESAGEPVWRMPLSKGVRKAMNSDIAYIKQVVEGGGQPGATVGAHMIGAFVTEATPWAHLDIAGNELAKAPHATGPVGAVGYGVRLLDRFVRDFRPVQADAPR